ncbi:MAG: hypothetical protein AB7O65_12600 [Candidatus Korobacteraceae bacterium]
MTPTYQSGDRVPGTAVYSVTHAEHRLQPEVALPQGQRFPVCSKCQAAVRFELLKALSDWMVVTELAALEERPYGMTA